MGKGTKHARDWKETKLQVVLDAKRLYCHSVKIMGNPKCFDPKNDFNNVTLITLSETFLDIYSKVWEANRINVEREPNMLDARLQMQAYAISECRRAIMLVELAKGQFHLAATKFWHWSKMIIDLGKKIDAWHKSDIRRYVTKEDLPQAQADGQSGCRLNSLEHERAVAEC